MSLHVECSTAPRDHFGRLLSPLESAEGLIWSETVGAGQISDPMPPGAGLILTLTPMVDLWLAMGAEPDPTKAPRRWLRAGVARTFEASGGLRIAWAHAETPTATRDEPRRTKRASVSPQKSTGLSP